MLSFENIGIEVVVSTIAVIISIFSVYWGQRKEREATVQHQAHVDFSLDKIIESIRELKIDVREIRNTIFDHETRIHALELKLEQISEIAKELKEQGEL